MHMPVIPYGKQSICEEDIQAVVEVLRSDYLTQGPKIELFERALTEKLTVPYAIVVSNGTAALHLSCIALDIKEGDIVWTTPISFVASINCARYLNARVDFVDINRKTHNLSIEALEEKLIEAQKKNALPKLLIVVHFAGIPCEMKAINALSKNYGFKIIEDGCHALGAKYETDYIGKCTYSDICLFSFHPVKNITSGEGGAIVTKSEAIAKKIKRLRTHGITRDPLDMHHSAPGEWYYEMLDLGFNYRMTDMQAALGISQLKRLDLFIEKRQLLAARYKEKIINCYIKHPYAPTNTSPAWHIYPIEIKSNCPLSREAIFKHLREKDIGVQVHYIPIHTHPYYQQIGFKWGDFPHAEAYYAKTLTLPLYPNLKEEEQDYVICTLEKFLS